MTAIATTDVTVTISNVQVIGRERRNLVTITFSLTTLTYVSATGVVMPAYSKFGMYRNLSYINIVDNSKATGVMWKWDFGAKALRPYLAPAQSHVHNLLLKGSTVTTDDQAQASATVLHRTTATADLTITSNATNGGIVSATLAAADSTELANTGTLAAATSIVGVAVGW